MYLSNDKATICIVSYGSPCWNNVDKRLHLSSIFVGTTLQCHALIDKATAIPNEPNHTRHQLTECICCVQYLLVWNIPYSNCAILTNAKVGILFIIACLNHSSIWNNVTQAITWVNIEVAGIHGKPAATLALWSCLAHCTSRGWPVAHLAAARETRLQYWEGVVWLLEIGYAADEIATPQTTLSIWDSVSESMKFVLSSWRCRNQRRYGKVFESSVFPTDVLALGCFAGDPPRIEPCPRVGSKVIFWK